MKTVQSIMLVDDDDISNYVNAMLIKKSGLEVTVNVFNSGGAALKYLSEARLYRSHPMPDIIFLDLFMPKISGSQFIRTVEKMFKDNIPFKIIIMTAHAVSELKEMNLFKKSFIKHFVEKPLTLGKVIELLT